MVTLAQSKTDRGATRPPPSYCCQTSPAPRATMRTGTITCSPVAVVTMNDSTDPTRATTARAMPRRRSRASAEATPSGARADGVRAHRAE